MNFTSSNYSACYGKSWQGSKITDSENTHYAAYRFIKLLPMNKNCVRTTLPWPCQGDLNPRIAASTRGGTWTIAVYQMCTICSNRLCEMLHGAVQQSSKQSKA